MQIIDYGKPYTVKLDLSPRAIIKTFEKQKITIAKTNHFCRYCNNEIKVLEAYRRVGNANNIHERCLVNVESMLLKKE